MNKTKAPFSTRVLIWLAKKYVNKITKDYKKKYNQDLPIVLVAGTAGKSSTTILIKQLFETNGWKVYSGATKEACLNSLSGLIMILSGEMVSFEHKFAVFDKLTFVIKSFFKLFLVRFKLTKKTALVYEVGFNEQNEADYFTEVFGKKVDDLILTNLTYEHSEGFESEFDSLNYKALKHLLPPFLHKLFESDKIEGVLKNIALEQFKLAKTAKHFIFPAAIGTVDNNILTNYSGDWLVNKVKASRGYGFSLVIDKELKFSDRYLLPITFGKYIQVLSLISDKYSLSVDNLEKTISDPQLPNGRFSLLDGINKSTIVDSSYNSDPASLNGFLDLFSEVVDSFKHWNTFLEKDNNAKKYSSIDSPKHYLVFGEMRELGEFSAARHKEILEKTMEMAKKKGDYIQEIFLLGREWLKCDESEVVKTDGAIRYITYKKQIFKVFVKVGDIINILDQNTLRPSSWVWVKGSQNTIFLESLVKHLLENPIADADKLCRIGADWDEIRSKWVVPSI